MLVEKCGSIRKASHGVSEEGTFQGQAGQHSLPKQKAVMPVFQGFL